MWVGKGRKGEGKRANGRKRQGFGWVTELQQASYKSQAKNGRYLHKKEL